MNVRQTDIEARKGKPGHGAMQQSKRPGLCGGGRRVTGVPTARLV